MADHAAFIHDVLDRAGVGPRVLVGHSMGAQFVLEAALQRPDQVPYVVLMGPVVDVRRRTVLRQMLALTKDALLYETPRSNAVVFSDYLRCGPRWYLKQLRVMMNYRTEDRIRSLNTPVMILRGASDPIATGEWCRILARRAPAGKLVEVPGCGHVVQYTGTSQVADAISAFTGAARFRYRAAGPEPSLVVACLGRFVTGPSCRQTLSDGCWQDGPMRILIAPDKFKGSLTAAQAASAIAEGALRVYPDAVATQFPVADGGEGTLEAAVAAGYEERLNAVVGPILAPIGAAWAIRKDAFGGATAVIETAQASGLAHMEPTPANALRAHSYGCGQLIAAALDAGATEIVLGVGGSAMTDGGSGACVHWA